MKILEIKTPKRLLGNFGEKVAYRYLRKHGYRIVKRNFVADNNEIDIIAESKDTLAFVEVKTRNQDAIFQSESRPAAAVDRKKQQKIIKAARVFLAFNPSDKKKQFDIIEVVVNQKGKRYCLAEIKHLKNTFNINTAFSIPKG